MPLSENEQRILQDIERSFYESDPDFARAVTSNGFPHAGRNCKLSAVGFAVFLVLLLVTFAPMPLVGFFGFLGMVACAALFVTNLRRLLRPRMDAGTVDESLHEMGSRFRDRFRRN